MFVCCECWVLSGRGLCDELITRPEESYRLWCVVVCDIETSRMRRPWPALGRSATGKKRKNDLDHILSNPSPFLTCTSSYHLGINDSYIRYIAVSNTRKFNKVIPTLRNECKYSSNIRPASHTAGERVVY